MQAYPDAVYKRDDGIVIIDPEAPMDEGIVDSCPYGTIYWNEDLGIGQKCTLCAHRIDSGQEPKCVFSCPRECLVFGDLDNPASEVSQLIADKEAEPLHPEYGTEPKVFYSGLLMTRIAGHLIESLSNRNLEGAGVTVRDVRTGETRVTESDKAGNFYVDVEEDGPYIVRVEAPGFYPRVRFLFVREGYGHLGKTKLFPK
jgi:nitrate reductase beta subunit